MKQSLGVINPLMVEIFGERRGIDRRGRAACEPLLKPPTLARRSPLIALSFGTLPRLLAARRFRSLSHSRAARYTTLAASVAFIL